MVRKGKSKAKAKAKEIGEGDGQSSVIKCNPNRKLKEHDLFLDPPIDVGETIDIRALLSTQNNFLIRANGTKVMVDDLKGKTIVLYLVPFQEPCQDPQLNMDLIDAYEELSNKPNVVFVFVAVLIVYPTDDDWPWAKPIPEEQQEASFQQLCSIIPFPTIPFQDKSARENVLKACRLHTRPEWKSRYFPYWSIIDSHNKVVATRKSYDRLFRTYGGAELYPLTHQHLSSLYSVRFNPRDLLADLQQLLTSPSRDFLLSRNTKVPISSLANKVVLLCFCEDVMCSELKKLLKEVYAHEKRDAYGFEIVQCRFHVHPYTWRNHKSDDVFEQESYDDVDWLRVPFKDPSHRKLRRIFNPIYDQDSDDFYRDFVVIVDTRQGVSFEFSGAEILKHYGVDGYPFTRQSLFATEYKLQKEKAKLKLLFPNFDLSGKRVLVLFAPHRDFISKTKDEYVSMLEAKYDVNKFQVVYVSSDYEEDEFVEATTHMQWIVCPYSEELALDLRRKLFKAYYVQIAAFNEDGELIAKSLGSTLVSEEFPFVSTDLEEQISYEVASMCKLDKYYNSRLESYYMRS